VIREILTCIFLLLGGVLSIVAAAGVLRMPDLLLTAPVAAHMIARAAYRSGVSLWMLTRIDEWKTHGEIGKEQ